MLIDVAGVFIVEQNCFCWRRQKPRKNSHSRTLKKPDNPRKDGNSFFVGKKEKESMACLLWGSLINNSDTVDFVTHSLDIMHFVTRSNEVVGCSLVLLFHFTLLYHTLPYSTLPHSAENEKMRDLKGDEASVCVGGVDQKTGIHQGRQWIHNSCKRTGGKR